MLLLYAEKGYLMRKFDYSFLKKDLIPVALINITSGISELKISTVKIDNFLFLLLE